MLENKDIEKLTSVLVTKKDLDIMVANNLKVFATKKDLEDMAANSLKIFATKQDVQEIRSDVADLKELLQGLLVSTDKMVKSIEILSTEYKAVSVQLTRHERWIKQLSDKIGVQLSFE